MRKLVLLVAVAAVILGIAGTAMAEHKPITPWGTRVMEHRPITPW